jgi:hypothetical protein
LPWGSKSLRRRAVPARFEVRCLLGYEQRGVFCRGAGSRPQCRLPSEGRQRQASSQVFPPGGNGCTNPTISFSGAGVDLRARDLGRERAGTSGQNFSVQCLNLPRNAFCVFNPPRLAVLPANVTGRVALGIATRAPTNASERKRQDWQGTVLLVCRVLALPLASRRPKCPTYRLLLLAAVLVGFAGGLSNCAGSLGSTSSTGTQRTVAPGRRYAAGELCGDRLSQRQQRGTQLHVGR